MSHKMTKQKFLLWSQFGDSEAIVAIQTNLPNFCCLFFLLLLFFWHIIHQEYVLNQAMVFTSISELLLTRCIHFQWNSSYLLCFAQIGHEIGFGKIMLLILYSNYKYVRWEHTVWGANMS